MDNFLNYITKNLDPEQVDIWFRVNNIIPEKMDLYYDLSYSLYLLIKTTYLGYDDDFNETKVRMTSEDNQNHFDWCWNKTIENFTKEKIYFKEKGNHYEYFWNFFFEAFYLINMDEKTIRIREYFYKLFDFRYRKSRSELDILTEVYKLMEQNLKKWN
jgi:hypothetical protein